MPIIEKGREIKSESLQWNSFMLIARNAVIEVEVENMHLICIVRDSKGMMKKERKPSLLSFIVFVNTPFGTIFESDLIAIISFVKKKKREYRVSLSLSVETSTPRNAVYVAGGSGSLRWPARGVEKDRDQGRAIAGSSKHFSPTPLCRIVTSMVTRVAISFHFPIQGYISATAMTSRAFSVHLRTNGSVNYWLGLGVIGLRL